MEAMRSLTMFLFSIFVPVIKSMRMGCAEHVTCMGENINIYTTLVGKFRLKRSLGNLVVDGKIILE
jgi:hypothetical protein